jgi:UrcA family protein
MNRYEGISAAERNRGTAMKKSNRRRTALRVAVIVGVFVSTLSIADLHCRNDSQALLSVDDSDLDLSLPPELYTLYQRLQDAAMQVCHPNGDRKVLPVFGLADRDDCYSRILKKAVETYDNLSLVSIHERVLEPPIYLGFDDE